MLMTEREIILEKMSELFAERNALCAENQRNKKFILSAEYALNYKYQELKMLDLIEFCMTGKYPRE